MDYREINHKWYESFDSRCMTLYVNWNDDEEHLVAIPAIYAVCDLCHGRGTCVNPSIDRHGISSEEFAEDPDFAEDYFSGTYDVQCPQCHGNRVAPEPNYGVMTEALKKRVQDFIAEYYADQREMWNERERGY